MVPAPDVISIGNALANAALEPEAVGRNVHVEILCELFTYAGLALVEHSAEAAAGVSATMETVERLAKDKSLEPRLRFNLEAVCDQKKNGWKARREKEKPKTKEEQEEEKAQLEREAQQAQRGGGNRGGGGYGGGGGKGGGFRSNNGGGFNRGNDRPVRAG